MLNLQSPQEANTLPDEQQQVEALGLTYANVPLAPDRPDEVAIGQALQALAGLPAPVLIHCGAGIRAGVVALIAEATEQTWTLAQLTEQAAALDIRLEHPHLQQFIAEKYP